LGMSALDFIKNQSSARNLTLTVIKTTPEQDAAALKYLNAHSNESGTGVFDNCAVRSLGALSETGVVSVPDFSIAGSAIIIPSDISGMAMSIPGATTITIPQGGPIPTNLINQFNPNKTNQCNKDQCSVGKR